MKNFMSQKYQSAILGPSSPDSVGALKKKFGKIFSCVCMFFKKSQPKKVFIKIR